MKSRQQATFATALVAVALVLFVLVEGLYALGTNLGRFDEPIQLVNALNVLRGQTPHTDFVSTYPPLHYYVLVAAFQAFGVSIVSARLAQILFLIACAGALLVYMRRSGTTWPRALSYTLLAVAAGHYPSYPSYGPLALSFLGLLVYLLSCRVSGARALSLLVLSGLLTGSAFVARINFGAYVAAAIWLEMFVAVVRTWRSGEGPALGESLLRAAVFTGAFLVCIAVYLAPYGADVPLVLQQIVGIPPKLIAGAMVDAPLGSLSSLRSVLSSRTIAVFLFLAFPLVWTALRTLGEDAGERTRTWALIGCVVGVLALELLLVSVSPALMWMAIVPVAVILSTAQILFAPLEREELAILLGFTFYLHYFLSRPDFEHAFFQSAIALLLLPYLPHGQAFRRPAWHRALAVGVLAAVAVLMTRIHVRDLLTSRAIANGVGIVRAEHTLRTQGDAQAMLSGALPPQVARTIVDDSAEIEAARYLSAQSGPSDPVYVGLADHSRPYINDIRFYWILDRPVGSRHTMLMTGIISAREAQAEVIQDLERRRVDWVVLWDGVPESSANRIAPERGAALLDEYIRGAYDPRARFGAFTVSARRAGVAAEAASRSLRSCPRGAIAGASSC